MEHTEKVLFCEIAWMRWYHGICEDDVPYYCGETILRSEDCPEAYNFQHFNRRYYGYLRTESIDLAALGAGEDDDFADDVLVIFLAESPRTHEKALVGWYSHARVYRTRRHFVAMLEDPPYCYQAECAAEDAVLLYEGHRRYELAKVLIPKDVCLDAFTYRGSFLEELVVPTVTGYLESWPYPSFDFVASPEELKECMDFPKGTSVEEIYDAIDCELTDFERIKAHNTLCRLLDNADEYYDLADALWVFGYCDEAMDALHKALLRDPKDIGVFTALAANSLALRRWDDAVSYANAALSTEDVSDELNPFPYDSLAEMLTYDRIFLYAAYSIKGLELDAARQMKQIKRAGSPLYIDDALRYRKILSEP